VKDEAAPGAADPRFAAAEAVLAEFGIHTAVLEVSGHDAEIALLTVPAAERDRLLDEVRAPLVQRLKSLGFRYVAVDLNPEA
jgi:PP-loop superfamily ATP-utilizing enzyme